MKKFNLFFILVLLLFTLSCYNPTDWNINEEIKKVTISNFEIFEYKTEISGDEEEAIITQQPEHYETSKIVRNSKTDWEAVYRYKPRNGFEGTDRVELKLGTGSDSAGPNTNIKIIQIDITVM